MSPSEKQRNTRAKAIMDTIKECLQGMPGNPFVTLISLGDKGWTLKLFLLQLHLYLLIFLATR
jgi:hypothetical protein